MHTLKVVGINFRLNKRWPMKSSSCRHDRRNYITESSAFIQTSQVLCPTAHKAMIVFSMIMFSKTDWVKYLVTSYIGSDDPN